MFFTIYKLFSFFIIVIPILISVAYLTLAERKVMGSMQQRIGPNVVGFWGLLQPLADGLKLLLKETVIPSNANTFNFIFAPVFSLCISLFSWALIPFSCYSWFVDIDLGLIFLLSVSSFGVYGIILSGWSSNSRYGFLGALRSTAQMISYEISLTLILFSVLICVGSLNFISIVEFQKSIYFLIPLFPTFLLFIISILAETNRAPFDLPEAESELVSGFNVEYSAMGFALFFLAEYSSMIMMSALTTILFLGAWLSFSYVNNLLILTPFVFGLKLCILLFFYIWVRASFPRYRIDQLMRLCWKNFLPIALAFFLIVFCCLFIFNGIF